ncbi:MAG: hypothetical protein KF884_02710 [Fimbriimonadaceae bacterium]|nr:hypothetical protein [Fimbriimonadaceae bacterium]QYK59007.1 MAG: hypothetical protein KF884_02710 [Fimbriimonadaceae bacterium]
MGGDSQEDGRTKSGGTEDIASESRNRGFFLDLFVGLLNLVAMPALTVAFLATAQAASDGDRKSERLLFAMAIGMFVLAPLGSTLKRWHYHRRRSRETSAEPPQGCLFNPIFSFCLTAVVFAAVSAYVLQSVYGKSEPPVGIFVGSVFGGIGLMVAHTVISFRYFVPPKSPPRSAFLRSPISGILGDACLYANTVLFQLVWNVLATAALPPVSGAIDFLVRLFVLVFLGLLLYFPPRMFYLADDIGRPTTWLTILLANSPVIVRVLFGGG